MTRTLNSQLNVVAMGPSQLLVAIAALRARKRDSTGATVFYRGFPSLSIDVIMELFCSTFGLRYAGCANASTFVSGRDGFGGWIDAIKARLHPKRYIRERLRHSSEELTHLSADELVISLRHNTEEDPFLLAALNPSHIIYTVDGVIVGPPNTRRFHRAERIALGPYGHGFPLGNEVDTPSYLSAFATKVGRSRIIPDNVLQDVFNAARIASADLTPKDFSHVILGQHLALSGLTTEMEEQRIWCDVFTHVRRQCPSGALLYKAHPRDRTMKATLLASALPAGSSVSFTTKENWALPLEAMELRNESRIYGLSSSALLYAAALAQHPAIVVCAQHWPDRLVEEVTRFAAETALPIEWIHDA